MTSGVLHFIVFQGRGSEDIVPKTTRAFTYDVHNLAQRFFLGETKQGKILESS